MPHCSSDEDMEWCAAHSMEQPRSLRVLIAGQHNSFDQIVATNIRCWGYEAVVLPSTLVMLGGRGIEGDVLLYDLDEAFRISTLVGGRDTPLLATGSCEERWPHVRLVIALSSRSVSRATIEQLGAVALLYKPFEMGRLQRYLQVLQRVLFTDLEPETDMSYRAESQLNLRILVADDDVIVAGAIRRCLQEGTGYEVIVAHDGIEALERCLSWHPHCIVTDLIMPWMNGYQIMRCLAASSLHTLPAFVVISALTRFEVPVNRAYLDGKTIVYLDKPFHLDHLLAAIEQALCKIPLTDRRSADRAS